MFSDADLKYDTDVYWKNYQQFFSAEFRCDEKTTPAEKNWKWREFNVHLDFYPGKRVGKVVVLLHGGMGYGRFLSPLAQAFHQAGYTVVAPDLIGHGLTTPKKAKFHYEDWVELASDLVNELSKSHDGIAVLGTSLGGMLAYHVAAKNPNVGAVIATTLADTRNDDVKRAMLKMEWSIGITKWFFSLWPSVLGYLNVPMAKFAKMDHISNTPAFEEVYAKDRLGGKTWLPLSFLSTMQNYDPDLEPHDFQTPLLLAHPGSDRWTPIHHSNNFFSRVKGPKEKVVLENCGHAPIEEPGARTLIDSSVAFLEKHLNNTHP